VKRSVSRMPHATSGSYRNRRRKKEEEEGGGGDE
jgi:hypothetical protein